MATNSHGASAEWAWLAPAWPWMTSGQQKAATPISEVTPRITEARGRRRMTVDRASPR